MAVVLIIFLLSCVYLFIYVLIGSGIGARSLIVAYSDC